MGAVKSHAQADCCSKCGGDKSFCSPQSGSCYASNNKDYYSTCATTPSDNDSDSEHVCCAKCGGAQPFCSPGSGNCYSAKHKGYYESCTTTTTTPCVGAACPVGWAPTDETRGTGAWCEVGVPADDWAALRTCGNSSATVNVKVLNYNLFWWSLFEARGGEDGRAGRKIATTNSPEEYDFMGFQECKDVDRVYRDAKRHGLPDNYETLRWDHELAMMYNKKRWTKLSSGADHVGIDSPKQYYGKRGVMWARFESNDGATVFFINHHGPLPVSEGGGCTGSATTLNILRVIAQNAHSDDGVVLVGDFNAHTSSSRIQTLGKHINRLYTGTSMGGVDHIFSNCGEEQLVRKDNLGSGGSDHHALSAVLRVPIHKEGVMAPTSAPTPIEPSVLVQSDCCSRCGGDTPFCSPLSGSCYASKNKDYYDACATTQIDTDSDSDSEHLCCANCGGAQPFCSPGSGNCYSSKNKDYYESCTTTDGGLVPPPSPPSEGGLVPPPPPPNAGCCDACGGHPFCSPESNTCYDSKTKSYYESCINYVPGSLVWSDEFEDVNGDGTVNLTKWSYLNGPNPNNQELQYYTDSPANSRIEDGKLKIVGKCEDYKGMSYTSARLVTKNLGDWGPGHRIEVKAKLPNGKGTWPAIWMLPTDNKYGGWPDSGEIDIMESVGCTRGSVYGTVHTGAYNHMKNTQQGVKYYTDETNWHTYAIDWDDYKIAFYVDGEHYFTFSADTGSTAKWPFNQRFYLILNLAVGGSWGGFCLNGGPSCSSADHFGSDQVMEVDYVRVYDLTQEATM